MRKAGYYIIKHEPFWTIGLALSGALFMAGVYYGNTKFDKNLIDLTNANRKLERRAKYDQALIQYIRRNSDSALDILAHMPYAKMKLDTQSWRKVQTTIENAGATLNLNK